jgi:hypothetical protein
MYETKIPLPLTVPIPTSDWDETSSSRPPPAGIDPSALHPAYISNYTRKEENLRIGEESTALTFHRSLRRRALAARWLDDRADVACP